MWLQILNLRRKSLRKNSSETVRLLFNINPATPEVAKSQVSFLSCKNLVQTKFRFSDKFSASQIANFWKEPILTLISLTRFDELFRLNALTYVWETLSSTD